MEPLRCFLDLTLKHLPPDMLHVVGVAIFQSPDNSPRPRVLVVKRAAHEDQFPNMWELPGGHVEEGETVRAAICRETLEETGLVVEDVLGRFEDLRWISRSSGRASAQYNYIVTVKLPLEIKLSAEEHDEWRWVAEDEVGGLSCSEGMKTVLSSAFGVSEDHLKVNQ